MKSYQYQLAELREYCIANNYEIVDTIANNISGRTLRLKGKWNYSYKITLPVSATLSELALAKSIVAMSFKHSSAGTVKF